MLDMDRYGRYGLQQNSNKTCFMMWQACSNDPTPKARRMERTLRVFSQCDGKNMLTPYGVGVNGMTLSRQVRTYLTIGVLK